MLWKMIKKRNPIAKELRSPRFKLKVIADKTKKLFRKAKHKKKERMNNEWRQLHYSLVNT